MFLTYAVDITTYLNKLSTKFQKKANVPCDTFSNVKGFQAKLILNTLCGQN
jgi:hypothetical protein